MKFFIYVFYSNEKAGKKPAFSYNNLI